LEKIVQVPFVLPIPNSEDIYKIFFDKMNNIIGDIPPDKWDTEYWSNLFRVGIMHYLSNIRNVERFVNSFSFNYALLKDETNAVDLIGLTCLQVFEPSVYAKLSFYKDYLCDSGFILQHDKENNAQQAFDSIVSGVDENKIVYVKGILKQVFPKMKTNDKHYSSYLRRYYNHSEALINNSVSNPDRFMRYFSLSVETTAIPNALLDHLVSIADVSEIHERILEFNSNKKISFFLEHVTAFFGLKKGKSEHSKRAKTMLEPLLLTWDELKDDKELSMLQMSFEFRLTSYVYSVLYAVDSSERYVVVQALFRNPAMTLSAIYNVLRLFHDEHNRFVGDRERKRDETLLTLENVIELERVFVERIDYEVSENVLIKNKSLVYILWLLKQLDEDKAKEYSAKLIKSELDLAYFVSSAVSRAKGESKTTFVIWRVRYDDMCEVIDFEEARNRIKKFVCTEDFETLSLERRENIAAFLAFDRKQRTEAEDMMYGGILKDKIDDMLLLIEEARKNGHSLECNFQTDVFPLNV
jgi:predicted KAP-like P-loop ATPase